MMYKKFEFLIKSIFTTRHLWNDLSLCDGGGSNISVNRIHIDWRVYDGHST